MSQGNEKALRGRSSNFPFYMNQVFTAPVSKSGTAFHCQRLTIYALQLNPVEYEQMVSNIFDDNQNYVLGARSSIAALT